MPTTDTFTVKPGGGGDYTSLNTALNTEAADLTSLDKIYRFDCYPGEDTVKVLGGPANVSWTTDATRYVELRFVDSGGDPAYTPTWSTSLYRLNVFTTNASVVYLGSTGIQHLWHTEGTFQVRATGDSQDFSGIFELHNSGFAYFDGGGILVDELFDEVESWRAFKVDKPGDYRWRNWIVYQTDQAGAANAGAVNMPFGVGTMTLQNCTFDGYEHGIISQHASNTITCTNCRFTDVTVVQPTWAALGTVDGSHNLATSTSFIPVAWTNSQTGATTDYTDDTNATLTSRNYSLASSSDDGYQTGTDLSSSFTLDTGGNPRSVPWDIGAHELSSSADDHSLAIQDCTHAHIADQATFVADESGLVVQGALHAHTADNASVTDPEDHTLDIRVAHHKHRAAQPRLSGAAVANIRAVDGRHIG